MNQIPNGGGDPGQERGWPQHAGRRSAAPSSLTSLRLEDLHLLAAAVIVVAVLVILLGALVLGLATDLPGDDDWKFRVKAIGLGSGLGPLGFSLGAAPFTAIALLVALGFVARSAGSAFGRWVRLIEGGVAVAVAWLVLFTLLGLVVDLTEIADAFPEVVGALLIDLGTLLLSAAAGLWALRALTPGQAR